MLVLLRRTTAGVVLSLQHLSTRFNPTSRILFRSLETVTPKPPSNSGRDAYFAAVHHVSNVVRRDFYLERTLNKLRISPDSELVLRVLRSCHSSPTESLRFFSWAQSHPSYYPTTLEFDELLRILGRARQWDSMWKIAEQMKNLKFPLSPETFCALIDSYGRHGLVDQAVEVFNRMRHFSCPQTVIAYNSLLSALCEVKNFQGAYSLIRRMVRKGVDPNKQTFAVLVNAWCAAGKLREAQDFLEEMSSKGFNPPVRGRDLLIDGLINAGYLESAKSLVRKMTKEGFLPDVSTFNSLLEAICRNGEIDFCVELLHDVGRVGLCPDISTYKIMIPAVSKVGRVEESFRLMHNLMEEGHTPFPSLYSPVLKALCRLGQFDDAFSFFSEMKLRGHPPNRPVYTMVIRMCARGGRFVEAANYLLEMTEMNLVPRAQSFDTVADGLKSCGKHELARRIEQLEISLRGL